MHDPAFPALHIRPPRGWINDPNGLCRIDGIYHVFFQYNPDAPFHGNVHWGHVSSPDLIHWEEQPIALRPRPGQIDADGCWSGCIVDDGGVPTAVYTANPGHARDATVALARGDRTLQTWTQDPNPVIGIPADLALDEVRDPFLFTIGGHRYAVQGAGQRFGRPMLLLYGCDDLEHWTELGPLLTDEDPIAAEIAAANIWECPNLVYLDGHWVLIMSLWRWADQTHELAGVRYLLGDLSGLGRRLVVQGHRRRGAGRRPRVLRAAGDGRRRPHPALGLGVGARPQRGVGASQRLGRGPDLPPGAVRSATVDCARARPPSSPDCVSSGSTGRRVSR